MRSKAVRPRTANGTVDNVVYLYSTLLHAPQEEPDLRVVLASDAPEARRMSAMLMEKVEAGWPTRYELYLGDRRVPSAAL